jgi:DNA-directed RNA polymerase specialized sigma24 family protein
MAHLSRWHLGQISLQDSSDATLLRACKDGDQIAWEILIRRYQRLIYSIPIRAGLNDERAAEVFQQVCRLLLERIPEVEHSGNVAGWLTHTAQRESLRQVFIARARTLSERLRS